MLPEIDEFPKMKKINIFETKETLINKNKVKFVKNDKKIDEIPIDETIYIHCRNCLLVINNQSKNLYNN